MNEETVNGVNPEKLKQAIVKKALGFDTVETVEEYSSDDGGEIKLNKKKVTVKNVPPDLSALKMLIDEDVETPLSEYTDEELEFERKRLLDELWEEREGEKSGKK